MSRAPSSFLRKGVLAGGAVVLFASAALVLVTLVTSTGPGPASAPGATAVAPPAPAEIPDAGYVPPPPLPKDTATGLPILPTGGPSAAPPTDPLPPTPPKGSWEAVPPAARAGTLGPVGAEIGRELLDLQPDVSACFDEVSQARHGQQAVAETQDGTLGEEGGATVLMLQVESSSDDEVRIVGAPVESRGGASDGLIACAQRVLSGHSFAAPGAKSGQRFRLMYTLAE